MTDRYAVIGNPIAHSKSPLIHGLFAQATGQDIEYRAILAPTDGFADAVDSFIAEGGKGANVTLPFKQEAYQLATRLTVRAEQAGAAGLPAPEGFHHQGTGRDQHNSVAGREMLR